MERSIKAVPGKLYQKTLSLVAAGGESAFLFQGQHIWNRSQGIKSAIASSFLRG
jgi:hypothetical protein